MEKASKRHKILCCQNYYMCNLFNEDDEFSLQIPDREERRIREHVYQKSEWNETIPCTRSDYFSTVSEGKVSYKRGCDHAAEAGRNIEIR